MNIKSHHILLFILLMGAMHVNALSDEVVTNTISEIAGADAYIPPSLEPLFLPDSSYLTRCRFVQDLKSDLQGDEVDALLQFITSPPGKTGLSRDHFNSVGDMVIHALERQNTVPPALVDALIVMFRDEDENFTWRDYCVQHLGLLYANDAAAGRRDQIRHVWMEAMQPDIRMAGTAILAMRRNIGQEGVSKEYVSAGATEVAANDNQPDSSRLVAIQVAAELGNKDMLQLAREIVPSRHAMPFRMSAMATIGILGNTSDLPLLEKYTKFSDMRLRLASRAAVKKIQARLKQ